MTSLARWPTLLILLAAVAIGIFPLRAQAQLSSCSVSLLPVSFGTVDASSPTTTTGTGTITVTCTGLSLFSYTIRLSTGGSGSFASRRMQSGGNQLQYNLYRDITRTQVWGDGTGGSYSVTGTIVILGVSIPYPVYGSIPGNQNVPSGTYADTIQVTVTY